MINQSWVFCAGFRFVCALVVVLVGSRVAVVCFCLCWGSCVVFCFCLVLVLFGVCRRFCLVLSCCVCLVRLIDFEFAAV